jgi:hypothetical protein
MLINDPADIRFSSCGSTPVDSQRPLLFENNIVDDLGVQHLGQIGFDKRDRFVRCYFFEFVFAKY